jgi:hypothetical protein
MVYAKVQHRENACGEDFTTDYPDKHGWIIIGCPKQ